MHLCAQSDFKLKGTNPEIQPLCQGELTLFDDTWKLNIHSDGTAASWHKHFILWVENTIKVFPTAQRSSVFCEKANISNRFVCDSVRPFLPHLVGTNTIKRFSVSLHLDELSSVCRTRRAWFDLELIYSTFSRSVFLHAAVSHFRSNQMHLFGLQGVTASSEIKRVQTNGFLVWSVTVVPRVTAPLGYSRCSLPQTCFLWAFS